MSNTRVAIGKFFTMTAAVGLLTGCIQGGVLDMDRSVERKDPSADQFGQALPQLRNPDNNGIISYDDYQVAIARRGETLDDIASRLGLDPVALARNNGIRPNDRLRDGNVIVLPKDVWVGERTSAQGANDLSDTNDTVEITKLAQSAIDDADPKQAALSQAGVPRAEDEPIRHRVERGETAFTISRLYNVSVRSLADWNGLNNEFGIREGQYLLIPVGNGPPEKTAAVTKPGAGTLSPPPPSAAKPLPANTASAGSATGDNLDLSKDQTVQVGTGRMVFPVKGKVIREYAKGKNDGIDMSGNAGGPVVAAASGKVAAITADADQIPIMVIKHPDNVLTVYANVHNIQVAKGDNVSRGQQIAELARKAPVSMHFEIRKGFNSVDPMGYLQ
jgi:LysM repeat protein